MRLHTHIHTRTRTYTCIHIHICIRKEAHIYPPMHACIHNTYSHTHTCIHNLEYLHTRYMHAFIHPYIHTRTYMQGDKTYVEGPICGGPCAAFSSGAPPYPRIPTTYVEAPGQPSVVELWRPTIPYNTKIIKGDKTYVEGPWLWRPLSSLQ